MEPQHHLGIEDFAMLHSKYSWWLVNIPTLFKSSLTEEWIDEEFRCCYHKKWGECSSQGFDNEYIVNDQNLGQILRLEDSSFEEFHFSLSSEDRSKDQ